MNIQQRHRVGQIRTYDRLLPVLRLLLLAVTWQGPLPIWHCHGTVEAPLEASVSSGLANWLSQHLLSMHSVSPFSRDQNFGWHVHFCLPGTHDSDDDESRSAYPQDRLSGNPAEESLHAISVCGTRGPDEYFTADTPVSSALLGARHGRDADLPHFFVHYAPGLAVPIRFCVVQC